MSETYKKILKDGYKVQVESAIRDGEGVKISTNYAKKSEIPTVNNATITITQGGVSKGSFTLNQSSDDTITLDAGGSSTDVQVNGTSITSNGVANLITNTAYNSSSNKIATMSDVPSVSLTTTSGSESITVGSSSLSFGSNAFNSTTFAPLTDLTSDVHLDTQAVGFYKIVGTTTTLADIKIYYTDENDYFTIRVSSTRPSYLIISNGLSPTTETTFSNSKTWLLLVGGDIYHGRLGATDSGFYNYFKAGSQLAVGTFDALSVALNTTRTGQHDTVVEYWVNSDGTSWYRKWASGWKECGGKTSMNTDSTKNITLPIVFSNNEYAVTTCTVTSSNGDQYLGGHCVRDRTTVSGQSRLTLYDYDHGHSVLYYCAGY